MNPNSNEWLSLPIDSVEPYDRQLRRHDRRKISKLKSSSDTSARWHPIIVDTNRTIIDGHASGRPCANSTAATSPPSRSPAAPIRDKGAPPRAQSPHGRSCMEQSELRAEFEDLISLSFDLQLTAFDTAEIDHVLELDLPKQMSSRRGRIPAVQKQAVSKLDDIWICGDHRLGLRQCARRRFRRARARWRPRRRQFHRPAL